MSFICEECEQVQYSRSKPVKVVVERRDKRYPRVEIGDETIDSGGSGWEVVREIIICRRCDEHIY